MSPGAEHDDDPLGAGIAELTAVLTRVAAGDLEARAPRSYAGDPLDVLAFAVNATLEELAIGFDELRRERDELRRMNEALVHTEKLAALGELAGGIAHELNQPLTVLRALASILRARKAPPTKEEIELIGNAAARMSRIVDGVRTFARQGDLRLQPTDPRAPLEDAMQLVVAAVVPTGVVLETEIEDELPAISADRERLSQVLVNLLTNALDAVVPDPRRSVAARVLVRVSVHEEHVVYRVTDTGPGIAPEVRDRLFQPFFTTKERGKGTGLGLSVSLGIVREHGGSIAYEAAPSGGASFVVRIPRARLPHT